MTYHNPMNQYRTVDAYGAAAAGDRVQLIARLMQGALDRIATARGHMQRGEVAIVIRHIKSDIPTLESLNLPATLAELVMEKRGQIVNQNYLTADRVELVFEMPLGEVVFDFFDRLKSISKGYASFDYHMHDFRESDLVKMDIK